jgi:hypothetical protein
MKNSIYIIVIFLTIIGCSTSKPTYTDLPKINPVRNDTIRIANDSLQYEVLIIDAGFSTWLNTRALPRTYHSQSYLESKNRIYVREWNNRVAQPLQYSPDLYEMTINYENFIDYGFEVNYLIYNYMIYFQNTYNQRLFGNVPIR